MMWNDVELGCAVGTMGIVGALRAMGAVGVSSVECGDVTGFLFFEYLADGEEYA